MMGVLVRPLFTVGVTVDALGQSERTCRTIIHGVMVCACRTIRLCLVYLEEHCPLWVNLKEHRIFVDVPIGALSHGWCTCKHIVYCECPCRSNW